MVLNHTNQLAEHLGPMNDGRTVLDAEVRTDEGYNLHHISKKDFLEGQPTVRWSSLLGRREASFLVVI